MLRASRKTITEVWFEGEEEDHVSLSKKPCDDGIPSSSSGGLPVPDAAIRIEAEERDTGSISSHHESEDDVEAEALLRAIARAPSRRARSAAAPGTPWGVSGRYIVGRRLGRGGMGTVYAASDTVLHRVVALKILDAAGTGHQSAH